MLKFRNLNKWNFTFKLQRVMADHGFCVSVDSLLWGNLLSGWGLGNDFLLLNCSKWRNQRSIRAHFLYTYTYPVPRLLILWVFITQIIAKISLHFKTNLIIFQQLNNLKINLALVYPFVLFYDSSDLFQLFLKRKSNKHIADSRVHSIEENPKVVLFLTVVFKLTNYAYQFVAFILKFALEILDLMDFLT